MTLLIILCLSGLIIYFLDITLLHTTLAWIDNYRAHGWLPPLLIIFQILLFTFALPGSLLLWVVSLIYPPESATAILVIGSTLGGLSAYYFSRFVAHPVSESIKTKRIYRLLRARGDFFTLCALRTMPGFPHSVINYSAGLLRLSVFPFIAASLIGLSIKTYLYARIIYQAAIIENISDVIRTDTLLPLFMLSILFLLARFIQNEFQKRHPIDHN